MMVLIILIIALSALVLVLYLYRRRDRAAGYTPYIEGLVALLEKNDSVAMKKLQEAVNTDSDLVDAYVRLGDLYRKKGDVSRAIQIHQSLTVRPTLKKHEEKRIYYALVEDLFAMSRHNKAVAFLKEILKIDKKDTRARELILKIYEDMESYGDCIALYEEGHFKKKSDRRHAYYYAALAHNKLRTMPDVEPEEEKEAVNLLKKALRISPDSLSALYYFGKYYEQKGDLKRAREYYGKIMRLHPQHAFMIINAFEKVMYELDLFDEIFPIYEQIFTDDPKNFTVGVALANLYEKKNDKEQMQEIYRKLTDVFPESILPKLRQIRMSVDDNQVIDTVIQVERAVYQKNLTCSNCGHSISKFSLLCPKCGSLESLLPSLS
ncbi:MAG: tetratricopeptide repeat protein [candidate division WOR-3 bacterium]|nr:MAG: tetratricopeptide repeat protein [candidate division WOR-3 bacterium]